MTISSTTDDQPQPMLDTKPSSPLLRTSRQTLESPPRSYRPDLIDGFVKGRISVIMPAFNEVDCIVKSISAVKQEFDGLCNDYEIIVVDDGSEDGTGKLLQGLRPSNVKIISYVQNRGKGFAFKTGFHQVTGEFTFLIDSDLEILPRELRSYVDALKSSDVVIGSKRHPQSLVRTIILRKFLSIGYNILERLLVGVRVRDTQAGLKAWRSSVLYRAIALMSVKRYAFDLELLAIASLMGLRVREMPIEIDLRLSIRPRQLFLMFLDTLGIAYRLRLKRWYQENLVTLSRTYRPHIP